MVWAETYQRAIQHQCRVWRQPSSQHGSSLQKPPVEGEHDVPLAHESAHGNSTRGNLVHAQVPIARDLPPDRRLRLSVRLARHEQRQELGGTHLPRAHLHRHVCPARFPGAGDEPGHHPRDLCLTLRDRSVQGAVADPEDDLARSTLPRRSTRRASRGGMALA